MFSLLLILVSLVTPIACYTIADKCNNSVVVTVLTTIAMFGSIAILLIAPYVCTTMSNTQAELLFVIAILAPIVGIFYKATLDTK